MNDDNLEQPTVAFFARVVAIFLVFFLAAVLVLHLSGCSSPPSPLTVADAASNTFADEINMFRAAWKRKVFNDALRGELACKVTDMACRAKAVTDAADAHYEEERLLTELALTQDLLQDALMVARRCKLAQDQACASASLENAAHRSSELQALLAAYNRTSHP